MISRLDDKAPASTICNHGALDFTSNTGTLESSPECGHKATMSSYSFGYVSDTLDEHDNSHHLPG